MKTRIPLRQVPINDPCTKDWSAMTGDAKTRFCDGCQKHVHNLSAMTTSEAEQLVCSASGRMCVRYEFNTDGSVKMLDYAPVEKPSHGWGFWALVGGVLTAVVGGAHAVTKQPVAPPPVAGGIMPPPRVIIMGEMVAPSTQPATQPVKQNDPEPAQPVMGKIAAPEGEDPTTRPTE